MYWTTSYVKLSRPGGFKGSDLSQNLHIITSYKKANFTGSNLVEYSRPKAGEKQEPAESTGGAGRAGRTQGWW